jgi:hypothetical protein
MRVSEESWTKSQVMRKCSIVTRPKQSQRSVAVLLCSKPFLFYRFHFSGVAAQC